MKVSFDTDSACAKHMPLAQKQLNNNETCLRFSCVSSSDWTSLVKFVASSSASIIVLRIFFFLETVRRQCINRKPSNTMGDFKFC